MNLEHETNILWLDDPAKYPYLREYTLFCTAKRGFAKRWANGDNVVAIAELSKEPRTIQRRLYRRAWHFDPDKDPYPGKDKPSEAVFPDSISPGKMSRHGRR